MNIFVYADIQSKMDRCRSKAPEGESLTDKQLEKKIQEVDKNRKNYHKVISNIE